MLHHLDLELIFPIRDEASASLMVFKADCLYRAGVLDERQWQQVQSRSISVMAMAQEMTGISGLVSGALGERAPKSSLALCSIKAHAAPSPAEAAPAGAGR